MAGQARISVDRRVSRLLKAPRAYILDESTSALDPPTRCTVVVIAHRLTTVTEMDRIFVVGRGRLLESGTQAELLALGWAYRDLWDGQSTTGRT